VGGAAGGAKVTGFDGEPPKRAVVQVWDSMDKIQAWRDNPEYKELRKVGEKYAKFRAYTIEGLPQ
jgi:heme-degrading monooxygenase HmoA